MEIRPYERFGIVRSQVGRCILVIHTVSGYATEGSTTEARIIPQDADLTEDLIHRALVMTDGFTMAITL